MSNLRKVKFVYSEPFTFNGLSVQGTVKDGYVVIDDTKKMLFENEAEKYPDGTLVKIFSCMKSFVCISLSDMEKTMEEKKEEIKKNREKEVKSIVKIKKEIVKFNEDLRIPVRWRSEVKSVVKSFTRRSTSDGVNPNTVFHVLLLEDLSVGRIQRSKNSFLCSSQEVTFSKFKNHEFSESKEFQVNCKKCLELAGSLRKGE